MGCSPVNVVNEKNKIQIDKNEKKEGGLEIKQLLPANNTDDDELQENFDEYDLLLGNQINSLSIKTEIFLFCKNLPKLTTNLNSFIKVFRKEGNCWLKIGQTEVAKYSVNPYYIKSFIMNYHFEEDENSQRLKFQIFFIEKEEITKIGEVIVTLKDILTSKNQELEKVLEDKKAKLFIKGVQKQTSSKYVNFKLGIKGKKLSKQKIYCKISKQGNHGEFLPIYETEEKEHITSKKEKLFFWSLVDFEFDRLDSVTVLGKNEDLNIIKFQIFELKKNKPKLLTEVDILTDELQVKREYRLKQYKNEYHFLIIEDFQIIDKFTIFSFLISGMEYQCFFILDLTRSKFNCEMSDELGNKFTQDFLYKQKISNNNDIIYRPITDMKCIDKDKYANLDVVKENILKKNEEEACEINQTMADFFAYNRRYKEKRRQNIKKRINVIESTNKIEEIMDLIHSLVKDQFSLDSDNRCPLYGYGCHIPPDYDIICNCVSLSNDIMSPEVSSGKDILKEYNKAMSSYYLSGPGMVAETFKHFISYVQSETFSDKNQKYSVAFYIISSNIQDLSVLFNDLNRYNNLPFTVVIVSIGKEFDGDLFEKKVKKFKSDTSLKKMRNNLIYVNFHKIFVDYTNNSKLPEKLKNPCKLLYNRLNEQFVDFINIVNVKPFDFENIKNKNTPNFIDFKKKKMNEKPVISKYLISEKNKLVQEIKDLKYSIDFFEETFNKKLPTFDRHYIITQLNKQKCNKNKTIDNQSPIKRNMVARKFIRFHDQIIIDESELLQSKKENNH